MMNTPPDPSRGELLEEPAVAPSETAPSVDPASSGDPEDISSQSAGNSGMDDPTLAPRADCCKSTPDVYEDLDAPTALGGLHAAQPNGKSAMPRHRAAPSIGSLVGPYELLGEVARGGMGVIYRAKHQRLGRIAAIKMILDADAVGPDILQRFETETQAAASLNHPGIVPLFESGTWNGYPYFAMAFVEGQSLLDRLREGPLGSEVAARLAASVADAMAHAHEKKIIHRDIKPANILIDAAGRPHITDFGVCKNLESGSELTTAGEMVGTPHYMPPEQAGAATVPLGPAADVYSIGAVLYAMLTSRPPFQAATPIEVVSAVLTQDPVPPRRLNGGVPVDLSVITMKCLSKKPSQRYASAGELRDDLNRFINDEPIHARPPGRVVFAANWVRRHVMFASVSSGVVLALVALTLVTLFSLMRTRNELTSLRQEYATAKSLLDTERRIVVQFMQSQAAAKSTTDGPNAVAKFRHERLRAMTTEMLRRNRKLAFQLAIETAELSLKHNLPLSPELRRLLHEGPEVIPKSASNESDAAKTPPMQQANTFDPVQTIEPIPNEDVHPGDGDDTGVHHDQVLAKLIRDARQRIEEPLTDAQRRLFGLPEQIRSDPEKQNTLPETSSRSSTTP